MKLGVRIAVAKRLLQRIEEDQPLFEKRIEQFTDRQKILARALFQKIFHDARKDLGELVAERGRKKA